MEWYTHLRAWALSNGGLSILGDLTVREVGEIQAVQAWEAAKADPDFLEYADLRGLEQALNNGEYDNLLRGELRDGR